MLKLMVEKMISPICVVLGRDFVLYAIICITLGWRSKDRIFGIFSGQSFGT
jgi:hypothetical protein